MTITMMPICIVCKHLKPDYDVHGGTCAAYPEGIPDAIWNSSVDHRQPHEGDHGIEFAPKDENATRYADALMTVLHS